jgi:hypothetical protein
MRVEIKTSCEADVYETWEVEVPDGPGGDDLRDAALEALWRGKGDLIEDEHNSECNQQIIRIGVLRA